MRVLFVISVLTQGRGGHFHSLDHISREVASEHDVKIITIGPQKSQIIKSNPFFLSEVFFNGLNIFSTLKETSSILKDFSPDIIHCFDVKCYLLMKLLTKNKKYKFVLNKCGGPNPMSFPKIENLILFSKEDELWFNRYPKFNVTNIYLIPNRVGTVSIVKKDVIKDQNLFNFVHIARIGSKYKGSLMNSIRLIQLLSENKICSKLYIIGTIVSEESYKELLSFSKSYNVEFLTNDVYTKKASEMLYLADAAIATGRGIMEASSLGLPLLTPAANASIPILITEGNFQTFFTTNFSERNMASDLTLEQNESKIVHLIKDKQFQLENHAHSLEKYDTYFNIKNINREYKNVYLRARDGKYITQRFSNIIYKLKVIRINYLSFKNN